MDYKQDDGYKRLRENSPKMPFYMTYTMQNIFLEEAEYEKDMLKLKRMYPAEVRKVQECVEEECDKMEYEGSMMFDEYPDVWMLRNICNRIYEKVNQPESLETEELRMIGSGMPKPPPPPPPPPGRGDANPGLRNLIEVMLYNEMYQRRCRHRRCRQWW